MFENENHIGGGRDKNFLFPVTYDLYWACLLFFESLLLNEFVS